MSFVRTVLAAAVLVTCAEFVPLTAHTQRPPPGGSVSVTPDGSSTANRYANTSGHTAVFTVRNTGSSTDYFYISCSGSSGVTCTGTSTSGVSLGASQQTNVSAYYNVGSAGNGQISLHAFSEQTMAEDDGYWTVPIITLPAPDVDVTPYNYDNQRLAPTHTHSTVPYYSHDTPRNVTLAYNAWRVNPKPFIHVNVRDSSGHTPAAAKFWLQVKRGGVLQYFANGETTLKFTAASSGYQRLAGQLRDSTLSTGVYDIEIIVTTDYGAEGTQSTTVQSKLTVVNESASYIARGWTVAGMQRAYEQGDESVLITEGDGSAVYFEKSGSNFIAPAGEFSELYTYGTGFRRLYADSTDVRFNSNGDMTDVYDQFNNRTQFLYSPTHRLNEIIDPYGKQLWLYYSSSPTRLDYIRSNITPYRITDYTVQTDGRLTRTEDPDDEHTDYGYDSSKRLTTITDRRGSATTLGYDSQSGTLTTLTTPAVPIFDVDNDTVLVTRDTAWQRVGVPYSATSSTAAAMLLSDSVFGKTIRADGDVTRFTVNRWGMPLVSEYPLDDALEVTTTVTYDDDGLPTLISNSADTADYTHMQYDSDGLVTSVRRNGTTPDTIIYGAWAKATNAWGTNKIVSQSWLGTNGRVDSTNVGAVKTRYTYDSRGRVLTVRDGANNLVQTNVYSGTNGNLSSVSRPGGRVTTYGYDSYGRRTTVSQAGLPTRTTYYDVLNRTDSVSDGVNARATRFGYDELFRTSITDPAGHVHSYEYNDLGWLIEKEDPANNSEYLEYSRAGSRMTWTNRRGETTSYTYDNLQRPTAKTGTHTDNTSFAYSSNGRVITATSTVTTETSYMSLLGQPDSVRTIMGGKTYWIRHNYSSAGVIDSTWATSSDTAASFLGRRYLWTASYGKLNTIRIGGKTTSLSYNTNLQLTSITYPGSHVVSQQYTTGHMNAKIETNQVALDELVRRMEFDTAGRIRNQYTPPVPVEFGTVLGYDGLNRLVSDTMGMIESDECSWDSSDGWECPAPTTDSVRSFVYDSIGNVKRDSLYRVYAGTNNVVTGTYSGTTGRISTFAGCTYTPDADGNIVKRDCAGTSSDIDTLLWSSENRLEALVMGSDTIENYYDHAGRLVKRDVDGTVSYFLWDGNNLFAELSSTGGKVAEYSYWPGGLDHQHALIVSDTVYFSHRDGFGNVVGLVNESKVLKRRYTYDAWGTLVGGSDTGGLNDRDRARFKGALWMGEDGPELYYMRNRWYEPKTGRFLSEDPIGLAGGINLYSFAGNNPISGSDPTGLKPWAQLDAVGSNHNSRDIDNAWGGSLMMEWLGGGGAIGINSGSAVHRTCGNRVVMGDAKTLNPLFSLLLCRMAKFYDTRFYATGAGSGFRTPEDTERLNRQDRQAQSGGLHEYGFAIDMVAAGLSPWFLGTRIASYMLVHHPNLNSQIFYYNRPDGYVHFGTPYYRNDWRGYNKDGRLVRFWTGR